MDRRRLDQNGKIHVRTAEGATAGDISTTLANQSPREDAKHVTDHNGTNDCSKLGQAVGHGQLPGAIQAPGEVPPPSNHSRHLHCVPTQWVYTNHRRHKPNTKHHQLLLWRGIPAETQFQHEHCPDISSSSPMWCI